jgi:hypothetical protein
VDALTNFVLPGVLGTDDIRAPGVLEDLRRVVGRRVEDRDPLPLGVEHVDDGPDQITRSGHNRTARLHNYHEPAGAHSLHCLVQRSHVIHILEQIAAAEVDPVQPIEQRPESSLQNLYSV